MTPVALSEPASSEDEFTVIYDREFDYVWRSLRRLGVPARDLPDVTQDVFMTLLRRLSTLDRSRTLRPWLFGVAFRVAADHQRLRRNTHERLGQPVDALPSTGQPADEQMAERHVREQVRQALDTLDLNRRGALIMHDIEGFSAVEIAEAFSIPIKTAYSRIRSARELFAVAVRRVRAGGGES